MKPAPYPPRVVRCSKCGAGSFNPIGWQLASGLPVLCPACVEGEREARKGPEDGPEAA